MKKQANHLKGLRLLSQIIPAHEHWKIKILNRWDTLAQDFSKNVHIKKIEGETLFLEATHPAWAQEIRFSTEEILKKINTLCGEVKITKIITLGSYIPKKDLYQESLKPEYVQRTLFSIQPASELNDDERDALKPIRHKKLATSMAEFYQQCKRRSFLRTIDTSQKEITYDLCSTYCTCSKH